MTQDSGGSTEGADEHGAVEMDWKKVAVCRGFHNRFPTVGQLVRIMFRLGGPELIDPPKKKRAQNV